MNRYEAVLAAVNYPWNTDIHELEDHVEHINGVSEFSINPVSGNALILLDRKKTTFAKARKEMKAEGVLVYRIIAKRNLRGA